MKFNIPFADEIERYSNIILPFAIIVPYLLYSFAYKNPELFKKILTQDQLIFISSFIKAVCMGFYSFECFKSGINEKSLAIGLPLVCIGQILNYLIYQKLGKVRAYYGWELGLDNSPPLEGFPLTIGHAQYKGCLLCLLGTYLCFYSCFRLTAFTLVWSIMYFYITLIESTECGRKDKSD